MKNGKYILVIAPINYPGKKYRDRYCYEHILIWWKKTGFLPKADEVVHHINNNHTDNRFENLKLIKAKYHRLIHVNRAKKLILICSYCGKKTKKIARNVKFWKKKGQKNFFCNRHCMGKYLWRVNIKRLKNWGVA